MQAFEIFIATSTAHNDQSLICVPFSCFWLNVMSHDQMLYNMGLEYFLHIYNYTYIEYFTLFLPPLWHESNILFFCDVP